VTRSATLGLFSWLVLLGVACDPTPARLTVRIQSGLRAGDELRHARARVLSGSVRCSSAGEIDGGGRELARSDQQALGEGSITIAEIGSLSPGIYTVHVLARRPGAGGPESGAVLIERCVVTSVTGDRVLRVPLTTDCIGVTCPAPAGSPAFDQCLQGRCVDPRCDPDDPATSSFCCDRSVLGEECDIDPTLCRDSSECMMTLDCSGASTCEGGVCVEPAGDTCPDGEHCDALSGSCEPDPSVGSSDAGLRDAGLDAPLDLDAPSPDAFAVPDAGSLDAVILPADAHTDATTERAGEDCTLAGDEDLDGVFDCEDPECVTTVMCTAGCTVLPSPPRTPTAAISPPTHWYRIPESVVSNTRGEVCALRDLAGSAHFMAIDRTITGIRSYASTRQGLAIDPGQRLASPSNLGLGPGGGYSAFVVLGPGDPETLEADFTMLRTWAPASSARHFSWQVSYASGPRYFTLGVQEGLFDVGFTAGHPFNMAGVLADPIVAGDDLASRIRYFQGLDSPRVARLTGGSGIAGAPTGPEPTRAELGPSDSAGVRLEEIVLYDRVVSAAELAQVRTYLAR